MPKSQRISLLRKHINDQRKWIDAHGSTREGYIERYGSIKQDLHYGDGGEAIYKADTDRLNKLTQELNSLTN